MTQSMSLKTVAMLTLTAVAEVAASEPAHIDPQIDFFDGGSTHGGQDLRINEYTSYLQYAISIEDAQEGNETDGSNKAEERMGSTSTFPSKSPDTNWTQTSSQLQHPSMSETSDQHLQAATSACGNGCNPSLTPAIGIETSAVTDGGKHAYQTQHGLANEAAKLEPSNGSNVVIGFACTMNSTIIQPFVTSLRRVGYNGKVMLAVDSELDPATVDLLDNHDVQRMTEPCDEQVKFANEGLLGYDRFYGNMNQRRYTYYQQWLSSATFDSVWLLDVRDVVFQAHPFQSVMSASVALFPDYTQATWWITARTKTCIGDNVTQEMSQRNWPELCGGTIVGRAGAVLDFVTSMNEVMDDVGSRMEGRNHTKDSWGRYCGGSDQYVLNYVAFHSEPSKVHIYTRGTGPAYTVNSVEGCPTQDEFQSGLLLDVDGQPFPVVHKWDICASTWHLGRPGEERPENIRDGVFTHRHKD